MDIRSMHYGDKIMFVRMMKYEYYSIANSS